MEAVCLLAMYIFYQWLMEKKKSPSCSVKLSQCSLEHLVCFVCSLLHKAFAILYSNWIFSSLSSRKVDMFVINKQGKNNMYVIRIQSSEPGWQGPLKDIFIHFNLQSEDEVSSMS